MQTLGTFRRWLARIAGIFDYRDQRGVPVVEHLRQDLRYAGRMMRRTPGVTAIAVLSLALGIGANTAVFSLTNAVLLTPLPATDPSQLVLLEWIEGRKSFARSIDGSATLDPATGLVVSTSFSMPAFERMRAGATSMSSVFAFAPVEQLNVVVQGHADIAHGQLVTGDYYTGLGVSAVRGRTIAADDDRPGAAPVAVITYQYWERRFGRDPAAIGSVVNINGSLITIVGVSPPAFAGALDIGESPDVTLPMALLPAIRQGGAKDLTNAGFWWVRIMGRRTAGVTEQRAQRELEPLFQRAVVDAGAESTNPSRTDSVSDLPRLHVVSGSQGLTDQRRNYQRPLLLLTIIVGLVLLIACANVANLLLTRATARQREITVRLALGASRARVIKQLLVESLLLVVGAEALGLMLAYWGKNLLVTLTPDAGGLQLPLDVRVFGAATAMSVATALLFGLAPAFRATRVDVADGLKDGARSLRGTSRSLFSRALIVAQIAMSVVLLVDAALFLRTLHNLHSVNVGFNQDDLLLFRIDPRLSGYHSAQIPDLYRNIQTRLSAVPGVRAITFTRHPQLSNSRRSDGVSVVGRTSPDKNVPINLVGPQFFETMQLPVVMGRAFSARDDEHAPNVAIVNETFARDYFPGENAIGRRIKAGGPELEIVGIARDAKYYSIRQKVEPVLYVSYFQVDQGQASFAVRTTRDPFAIVPAIRHVLHDVDKTLSIFDVRTQRQAVDATLAQERLFAKLSTLFAVLAMLLACVGVYGVMSYATARRTGEIGIRIALGARGRSIVWLVMRRTVALVLFGIVIGLAAGIAGTKLFTKLLYDLSATDPLSLVGVAGVIAAVALAAAFIPANRARHVSPIVALRSE